MLHAFKPKLEGGFTLTNSFLKEPCLLLLTINSRNLASIFFKEHLQVFSSISKNPYTFPESCE